MKVPKMYKSSDRYNAGVDVIYDDDSKLQFAPFIYATTQSGDNGADDGGDEEGEETMLIKYDAENNRYDKTWQEVHDAVHSGKTVFYIGENGNNSTIYYVTLINVDDIAPDKYKYGVTFATVNYAEGGGSASTFRIACASASDYLVNMGVG